MGVKITCFESTFNLIGISQLAMPKMLTEQILPDWSSFVTTFQRRSFEKTIV